MTHEEFQRRVLDFQERTGADLATLKTHVSSLVGDGKPGRIDRIESDVKQLQETQSQSRGARHAFQIGLGFLGGLLGGLLRHHG